MKKQTAFQYYMQQHNIISNSSNNLSLAEKFKLFDELIQKTKQMEKEQIIDAHLTGQDDEKDYWNIGDKSMTRHRGNSMKYYEQTYGGNK